MFDEIQEVRLAENQYEALRVAAGALQRIRNTEAINDKEARGEEITPLDRLIRYVI